MRLQQINRNINSEHSLFETSARRIGKSIQLSDLLAYLRVENINCPEFQRGQIITILIENGTYRLEIGPNGFIYYRGCLEVTRFPPSKTSSHYERFSDEVIKNNQRGLN